MLFGGVRLYVLNWVPLKLVRFRGGGVGVVVVAVVVVFQRIWRMNWMASKPTDLEHDELPPLVVVTPSFPLHIGNPSPLLPATIPLAPDPSISNSSQSSSSMSSFSSSCSIVKVM